jgi:hypothetical protein
VTVTGTATVYRRPRVNPDGLRILGDCGPQHTRICRKRSGLNDAVTAATYRYGAAITSPSPTAPPALHTVARAEHDLASQLGQNRVV